MLESICVIVTFIILVICITWLFAAFNLPDGKFALKRLEYKLNEIKSIIERKDFNRLHFDKQNRHFYINIEKHTPVENFSYQKVFYYNIYINNELVGRLWHTDKTWSAFRIFEHTNKRLENEIFSLINTAYKEVKRLDKVSWKDFNNAYKESYNKKSYFSELGDKAEDDNLRSA